jgi:hypothetical protein
MHLWLAEAVADANKAIELDPTMHKAYYRKGLETLLKEFSPNHLLHFLST